MSSNACNHQIARKRLSNYSTDEFGIPLHLVDAVEEDVCEKCGKRMGTIVLGLDSLIAAAAIARAILPQKLSGREIRFLRKALKLSAKELGVHLDSKPETVSRWENNRLPMSSNSEKLLRLLTCTRLAQLAPAISYTTERILEMHIIPVHEVREDPLLRLRRVLCVTSPSKALTPTYIQADSAEHLMAA